MIKFSAAQLWVNDQDEALAFYTDKLGMEVRSDVTVPELDNFRWLTVGVPGNDETEVVLMAVPGPPAFEADTTELIHNMVAKGVAGTVFLTTDDCRATYEQLKARGVEFTGEPEERPYGVDVGLRDPSGNSLRLTEVRDQPAV